MQLLLHELKHSITVFSRVLFWQVLEFTSILKYCQLRRARGGPLNFLTNGFGILQRIHGIFSSSPLTKLSSSYSKLQKVQFVLEIEPVVKSISSVALFNDNCKIEGLF